MTGTGKTGNQLACIVLLAFALYSCQQQRAGVDSGLRTSDGNGRIHGLNEFTFETPESSLASSEWETHTMLFWRNFSKDTKLKIAGQERDARVTLGYDKDAGTLSFIRLIADAALEEIIYVGLIHEYGKRVPKRKHKDLVTREENYIFEDAQGRRIELGTYGDEIILEIWRGST